MIYDCFTFFNELQLLELRLNTLDCVVDKFVLVEATKTHSGKDKPLYFNDNKEMFSKFSDKIIHIIIDEYPKFETSWTYENHQRNCIIQGLKDIKPTDEILLSDVDEIPNPELVKKYSGTKGIKLFEQKMFYYFFNHQNVMCPYWYLGTKMTSYETFLNLDKYEYSYSIYLIESLNQGATLNKLRSVKADKIIRNGGWHFSYLGGVDAIIKKLQSFSHQEYNQEKYTSREHVQHCLETGEDLFGRGIFAPVELSNSFPKYLLQNKEKYDKFICHTKIKPFSKRYFKCIYYKVTGAIILSIYFYFIPPFMRPLIHKIKAMLLKRS